MQPIKLSVITPTFEGAAFLQKCTEHVAEESLEGVEHIVIDGGSSDGSLAILERASECYPRFRYISEPDLGQSDAMNKGIRLAEGEFITFLNVDDRFMPGALARMQHWIERAPSADFIVGHCLIEEPTLCWEWIPRSLHYLRMPFEHLREMPVNPSCYCYRRSLHQIHGDYNVEDHFAMDWEFLTRIAPMVTFQAVPERWGFFNRHEACKTQIAQAKNEGNRHNQRARMRGVAHWPLRNRLEFFLIALPKFKVLPYLWHGFFQAPLALLGWIRVKLALRTRLRAWKNSNRPTVKD